jgi:hypothetical protein
LTAPRPAQNIGAIDGIAVAQRPVASRLSRRLSEPDTIRFLGKPKS